MKLCLILLSAALLHTEAKVQHRDTNVVLCSETDHEFFYGLDGEEMWHADFTQQKGVMTLPAFADPFTYAEGAYESAVADVEVCKQNLAVCVKAYNYPAEPKVAPQSFIYPENEVWLQTANTLICYISGFYPAHAEVSWTRNGVSVTDQSVLGSYYVTDDGTFNLVSRLNFTPAEGDIYSCTVEHVALERPLGKTWTVHVPVPSKGPTVFCIVGLAVGLLGAAIGIYFFIKGHHKRNRKATSQEICKGASGKQVPDFAWCGLLSEKTLLKLIKTTKGSKKPASLTSK